MPPAARRPVLLLVSVAGFVVLVLGSRYAHRGAGEVDQRISGQTAAHLSGHPRLVSWLVSLGNPLTILALVLMLVTALVLLERPAAALLALLGPATAEVLTEMVLKPLVGRRLDGGLAYPSGHTTATFSVALVVGRGPVGFGPWSVLVSGGRWPRGMVLAGAVAVSLVIAGDHYPTDVVGGAGVATVVIGGLALLIDRVAVGQGRQHPANTVRSR